MNSYILVPTALVTDKELGEHRMRIYCYLAYRRIISHRNTYKVSLSEIRKWIGLSPTGRMGQANGACLRTLNGLVLRGYIVSDTDFCSADPRDLQKRYTLMLNPDYFKRKKDALRIHLYELVKIIEYKSELKGLGLDLRRVNAERLLLTLGYIRMHMREEYRTPRCYCTMLRDLAHEEGLNVQHIGKVTDALDALHIIRCKDSPYVYFQKCQENVLTDGKEEKTCYVLRYKVFADYIAYDNFNREIPEYDPDTEIERWVTKRFTGNMLYREEIENNLYTERNTST